VTYSRNSLSLEEKHTQAISVMLSDHFIGDSFDFKFLEEIFKQMGISKNQMVMDNKSIRIFNRLKNYLQEKHTTI